MEICKLTVLVTVLLLGGLYFVKPALAKEVEFTMSNYTHDYALRVTRIVTVN